MQYSPNVRVLTLGEASTFITLQSLQQQPVAEAPAVMDGFGTCSGCTTVCTHVVGPVGAGLCDNCRAPKVTPTPIDREAATVFVTSPGRGALLPLVTLHCFGCAELVDVVHGNLGDTETFGVSRVNGDSKYGYEPYHLACLPF